MRHRLAKLRVLGTPVTLIEAIRRKASAALGIEVVFTVLDGTACQRRAVMFPESFDVYDQWFHSVDLLWPAQSIQPIEVRRIAAWNEINPLPKTGRLLPGVSLGAGCRPVNRLYVAHDGTLGPNPTERISMLPLTYNADSFAYRFDELPRGMDPQAENWAWLLDPAWSGRVALQSDAAIGAIDAALAAESSGLASFEDVGNLSVEEIDRLISILTAKKKKGHFSAFWSTHGESAELLIERKAGIQSLWSPAGVYLHRAGVEYREATPKEGYRAWYGGLSISSCAAGPVLEAAYNYLNWWLSGWPGAIVARQGYYISNPERSRPFLSDAEWNYWYGGEPALSDLPGPDGKVLIKKGSVRAGGAYTDRMSHVAVWNSVMDEHNYLVRRWNELLNA